MAEDEKKLTSEAARIMGQVRSERKAAAARENRKKRPLKPLADFPCTCGGCPDNPKTYCARGRAIKRRLEKGIPLT